MLAIHTKRIDMLVRVYTNLICFVFNLEILYNCKMKMHFKFSLLIFIGFIFCLTQAISCAKKKDNVHKDAEPKTLKTYSLNGVLNIGYNSGSGAIDLSNGILYNTTDGKLHDSDVDIAYCYVRWGSPFVYERTFLQPFSTFADIFFTSWMVRNKTLIYGAVKNINFDSIATVKTKSALDKYYPPTGIIDYAAQISFHDTLVPIPIYFFKTVKGKRGIIRVNNYTASTSSTYYFEASPINLDVIIEE